MSRYVIAIVEGLATRRDVEVADLLDVGRKPPQELAKLVLALGGMTPVTAEHAILTAAHAVPQRELHSVPLSQADNFDPGEWEPFAVAQDRPYLRRPASRVAGVTGVEKKVASS